jgi:cellulose synthase (UDP-forming)
VKPFVSRLLHGASDSPHALEQGVIGFLGICGLGLAFAAATVELSPIDQSILAVATGVLFLVCNRRRGRPMTLFLTMLSALVSLRYIVWRITETLEFNTVLQGFLGTGLALAEAYAIVVLALGYIQTVWPLERQPVPLPDDPDDWPTVDVYIPTYNEDLSIVRATVLAAMAIDWPQNKLRVYILDDGRRLAFRDFAASCGCGYIIRPDNKHAKAGNLNHALTLTDGDFVAIFDCDHVPTRAFLQLTMGWLTRDPRLAFVQTPHHFYSPDPFQRNLSAGTRVPAEGNMFYGLLQDGNDFWDAAFFCGSCAVIRRSALATIGGFATQTVTEDAHTALRLHRKGWHSAYIRLPLAAGLATERLILHIGQRVRWARGMLQIMRTDCPLFGPGLSPGQRICYLNAMLHFMFAIPRMVFLTSPLAFLLFGQNIIAASPLAIIAYALPHIFHSVATNARIQGTWRHSFWSEIYETVMALFLVRINIVTMISPRRGRFNVTDKGGLLAKGYFDTAAVYPNLILAAILAIGLVRGLLGVFVKHTTRLEFQAFLLNSIWVTFSLLIVLAALAVGRETRQIRNHARVSAHLPVVAWLADDRTLQGISQNLSRGGGAFLIERPDDLGLPASVEIEFDLSGQRLILPATISRWEGRSLQVLWQVATIAEESHVVQAVFGRADAWLDWSRYPADRPLVSLWNVLVSIRGLFRLPGQMIATPEPEPQAAAAPVATATGTLARQSLMLQPRSLSGMAVLLLAFLLTAWPGAARAQQAAPAVHVPSELMPQSPPPTQPPIQLSQPSSPLAPTSDTRTEVLTLHDIGAVGPMTMRGTSAIQGVLLGVKQDEVVTDARLSLTGAMSPSLIPDASNVTVTLNEQYVGTIPVTANHPEFGPLDIPINPVFFQDRNRLNFRFTGRYAQDCNDPLSGLLWSTVSDKSTLTLTITRLPPRRDLARLPLPLFDENLRQKLVLPFSLIGNPSNDVLQASAIVASWFGKLADFRGTRFPVASELPREGNAVVVALARDMPPDLNLAQVQGPLIAEVANPNDPLATILVVAGRNGAEVLAAANTLSLGSRVLTGDTSAGQPDTVPTHKPYDAPAWIRTDRAERFGELVDVSALQGTGYVPGTFHVPFRTAPDLYTWRQRPFQADIRFRAPPGPVIDVAASRLDVSINDMFLRSYSLAPSATMLDWVMRTLGYARPIRYGSTPIPLYAVFGQNDLQMFFDARPLHRGDCAAIPEDLHMGVDPDSTLDLSSAYHFTTLPNLAFFANSGFPFSRMADLSDTAAILPQQPSPVELTAFLGLMGNLGALTFQPVNRLTVIRTGDVGSLPDKDLLVISTLGQLGAASALLERSPYRVEGANLRVTLPGPLEDIWHIFGDRQQTGSGQQAMSALSTPLGDRAAVLIGAPAPGGNKRSMVALLAGSPQGLDAMVDAMRDTKLVPNIQGDLALLAGGNIASYRAGSTYDVGSLPFWLWPEWWLQDKPGAIIVTMIFAAAGMGICLYRMLRWRDGKRTPSARSA